MLLKTTFAIVWLLLAIYFGSWRKEKEGFWASLVISQLWILS